MSVISQEVMKHLHELKAVNSHSEAYLIAAQMLGLNELAEIFESINTQKQAMGYLPRSLYFKQYDAYQKMLLEAMRVMTPEEYHKFYMCF